MATLAADVQRAYAFTNDRQTADLKVIASDIIYEGAAVGDNASGYARPLVALDPFLGFANKRCDNSAGAAGAKRVNVLTKGQVELAVVGATGVGDIGDTVYASDDATFTKTSTGNTAIGKIADWVSGTTCIVEFEALPQRSL